MAGIRKYKSIGGEVERTAFMESFEGGCGFYRDGYVRAHTESERGVAEGLFGSYEEAFDWLVRDFGCGWVRVKYE